MDQQCSIRVFILHTYWQQQKGCIAYLHVGALCFEGMGEPVWKLMYAYQGHKKANRNDHVVTSSIILQFASSSTIISPPAGQHGSAGQADPDSGEEKHSQRQTQAGTKLPAQATISCWWGTNTAPWMERKQKHFTVGWSAWSAWSAYQSLLVVLCFPASAQHPRCFHLDDEQQQARRLRSHSLQRHSAFCGGWGERKRLRQSQSCLPKGTFFSSSSYCKHWQFVSLEHLLLSFSNFVSKMFNYSH